VSGFVSFISAGPGDPELLTVKGTARLREADVVLYDDLASGAILDLARSGANLVAVGKRAGRPSTRQQHVNRLRAAGIGYEVIPGVTSACVAAAQAGIPLTRRHTSRRVQFVTGADVTGELPANLNWAALADPDATTVVYMGRRTFPALAAKLIEHGLAPNTPALFAESLGRADELLIRTTISELAEQLARGGAATTAAVILFGALARSPSS
jgi:uroporphyrin-III C-methyltransferase